MENMERGPDWDPEEWADTGPEPNQPPTPFGGVVPAGAMSGQGAHPAPRSRAPWEVTPFAAELEASNARAGKRAARIAEIDRQVAALDAERAQEMHELHEETRYAASLWVPQNREGYDQVRIAQTEAAQEVAVARRIPKGVASAQITEAEMIVTELPATFHAVSCGDISYRHAQRIASHASSLPPEVRHTYEEEVLPMVKTKTVSQAERKLKDVRERLHPESIRERHIRAVEDRTVYLTGRPDGMVELTAILPAEDGVSAFGRISATAERLKSKEDPRTKPQRMADVLTDLLLNTSTPDTTGIVPTVLVTVPVRTAAGIGEEPGSLNGYGIISPEVARDLYEKAPSFRRVLVDEDSGEVLNLGRTRYRPTAAQRLAVELKYPTCAGIGCNRRAENCEIDHTEAYNEGPGTGRTDLGNLHPLCKGDHTDKHNTRVRVASIEGNLVWTLPSGQQVVTEPEQLVHDQPIRLTVVHPAALAGIDLFAGNDDTDNDGDDTQPLPF